MIDKKEDGQQTSPNEGVNTSESTGLFKIITQKLATLFRGNSDDTTSRTYTVLENRSNDFSTLNDLLGTSRTDDKSLRHEGERTYQRPPYEKTKKLEEEIKIKVDAMSLDKMHEFIVNQVPQYLNDVATVQMALEDILIAYYIIEIIDNKRREKLSEQRYQGKQPTLEELLSDREELTFEEFLDTDRLRVARDLLYLVAFNEGLFGPNDLGYLPDTTMSLANKESMLLEEVQEVEKILSQAQDMFREQTEPIYVGMINRLNKNRAFFMGRRVTDADFPPFPKPALGTSKST